LYRKRPNGEKPAFRAGSSAAFGGSGALLLSGVKEGGVIFSNKAAMNSKIGSSTKMNNNKSAKSPKIPPKKIRTGHINQRGAGWMESKCENTNARDSKGPAWLIAAAS